MLFRSVVVLRPDTEAGKRFIKAVHQLTKLQDEMEYEIDADMLASHLRPNGEGTDITHLNGSDIKTVSVQYGRLGQQWVSTAGTSTGPWLGIGLSVAVVAAVLGVQAARRKKKADALATEVNQAGMTK